MKKITTLKTSQLRVTGDMVLNFSDGTLFDVRPCRVETKSGFNNRFLVLILTSVLHIEDEKHFWTGATFVDGDVRGLNFTKTFTAFV